MNLAVPAAFTGVFLTSWGALYLAYPFLARGVRKVAGRAAEWLRAHSKLKKAFTRIEVHKSYVPLGVALGAGAVVGLGAAYSFIVIAKALNANSPLVQHLDVAINEGLRRRRTPFLDFFFMIATTTGGVIGMALIVAGTSAILSLRGRFRWAGYLVVNAAGGALLNQLLKAHFSRERPDLNVAALEAGGWSFPSGHTMGSTSVLLALGYLLARAEPTWTKKSAAMAALLTADLAIGMSRLYFGVHWPSDVAAGLAAGTLWVAFTTSGYELVRQWRLRDARLQLALESGDAAGGPPAAQG